MVRGDPEWARELRRQLALEIELVASGLGDGAPLPDSAAPDAASNRLNDLRRRLEQVERLIRAIDALRRDEDVRRRGDAHGDARADARDEDGEAAHGARREAADNDNEAADDEADNARHSAD